MKIILSAALLVITITSFSQEFDDVMINPFWSFYSENVLDAASSGRGATGIGIDGSISSVNRNPASMEITGKYQAAIQYVYKTNQQWLPNSGVNDLYLKQNLFSGSAGFGYRVTKNFQIGFLYSNPASLTLNLGAFIVTNEFGEELGRYEAYDRYTVHSFSVPLVYAFDNFKIGLVLNYSLHRRNFNLDRDYTGKFDRFNIQSGILFRPIKQLSIGATFTPKSKGKVTTDYPGMFINETTTAILPLKAGAGFEYIFSGNRLKVSGDLIYKHTSAREGLKDQFQVAAGFEYLFKKASKNNQFILRGGFIIMQDPRDMDGNRWLYTTENYDQVFLTLGGTMKLKNTEVSLGIMDSHISSGSIKNTFINAGIVLDF